MLHACEVFASNCEIVDDVDVDVDGETEAQPYPSDYVGIHNNALELMDQHMCEVWLQA